MEENSRKSGAPLYITSQIQSQRLSETWTQAGLLAVRGLSTYVFSNEIFLVLNDAPGRDSNSADLSQGLGGMGFQSLADVLGHTYKTTNLEVKF